MNFMVAGFNAIDITVVVLVLLLGMKGFINGFARELFGLIGLIGGIFIASRAAEPLAKYVESDLFQLGSFALLKLISFIVILVVVWGIVSLFGTLAVGISKGSQVSVPGRVFGFVVAAIKYFLILSLIVAALFRSPLIKENMTQIIEQSKLYPTLDKIGSVVINLAPIAKPKITTTDKPAATTPPTTESNVTQR